MGADVFGNVNQYIVAVSSDVSNWWVIVRSCTDYVAYNKRKFVK